jgi:hypothetical protein
MAKIKLWPDLEESIIVECITALLQAIDAHQNLEMHKDRCALCEDGFDCNYRELMAEEADRLRESAFKLAGACLDLRDKDFWQE